MGLFSHGVFNLKKGIDNFVNFGNIVNMKKKPDTRLTIVVPKEFKRRVKSKASAEGKTMKQKTLELLTKWLDK